jgi:hypothetical protein
MLGSAAIFYFIMIRGKVIQSRIEHNECHLLIRLSAQKNHEIDLQLITSFVIENDELKVYLSEGDPVIINLSEFVTTDSLANELKLLITQK